MVQKSVNALGVRQEMLHDLGSCASMMHMLLKNFYTDAVKIEQWNSMEEMTSPTGYYWIFSEATEFFVIKNGVLADMSVYKVVKTEKEDDFIIQEAGIDKYIIKDLKSKGFETFYPLEFLNK